MAFTFENKMVKRLYRQLLIIRRVEERIAAIYPSDKVKSPIHLSIGQETVSVGVCDVLKHADVAFGTYRGHALYLAKGGDLSAMIAELFGKATGCTKGKGGSMHLIDVGASFMGTSAVVATTIPQAVGYALAIRQQGDDRVVACFFGEGATDEGAFHESINFAAIKELPILFVCENNQYAIHSHVNSRSFSNSMLKRAQAYGVDIGQVVDGNVFTIRHMADEAVQGMRNHGNAPFFMECFTCREREHVGPGFDWGLGYRSEEDIRDWRENDQIKVLGGMLSTDVKNEIERHVKQEIDAAFQFAEQSPFPDECELMTDLFK